MKLRLIVIFYFFTILILVHAQDIEVKKFEPMAKDQTATLSPRKDINGTVCGLVKVLLKETGVIFQGNIIGDVETTGTEYNVYLAKGCKRINIKHVNYLPKTIVFSDYGITKIESGKTYLLELKAEKPKYKKVSNKLGLLVLTIKPSDADLFIDDEFIPKENGGIYTLNLSQGNHFYSVKHGTFSINNQVVNVENKACKVDIDLTEYYAFLDIKCELDNAEIYIDKVLKGTGKWNGLLPPGEIEIETKSTGYSPLSRTMTLNENDSVSINFSNFQILSGNLIVSYKPDSCDVYIDGKKVGVTPLIINQIAVGEHRMLIEKPYYSSGSKFFTIEEGQSLNISGNLSYKNAFSEIWIRAHEGDAESQYKLALCYLDDSSLRYTDGWDRKNKDFSKAVPWLEKAANQGILHAMSYLAYFNFNGWGGLKRNYEKSLYWLRKCIDIKKESDTCYLMGIHYKNGVGGVAKDYKEAAYWFRQAILCDGGYVSNSEKALREIGYESYIP